MEMRTPVRCSLLVNAHKHGLLTPSRLESHHLTPRLLKNLKRRVNLELHTDKQKNGSSSDLGTLQAINGRISQLACGNRKEIDHILVEEDEAAHAYLCELVSPVACAGWLYRGAYSLVTPPLLVHCRTARGARRLRI